ncbi:MAG: anti-sigma factor family protein [Anaerolineae bacterium]
MLKRFLRAGPRHVEDMLSAYIDGELSPEQVAQVEEHLRDCPRCAWHLETLRRTVELLRELPIALPPRSFTIEEKPHAFTFRSFYPYLKWGTAAVAFLLAVVLMGGALLMFSTSPVPIKEAPPLETPLALPGQPEPFILEEEAAPSAGQRVLPAAPPPALPEPTGPLTEPSPAFTPTTPTEKAGPAPAATPAVEKGKLEARPSPAPVAEAEGKAWVSATTLWLWAVLGLSLVLIALGTATWLARRRE